MPDEDMTVQEAETGQAELDRKLAETVAGIDKDKLPLGIRAKIRAAEFHGEIVTDVAPLAGFREQVLADEAEGVDDGGA